MEHNINSYTGESQRRIIKLLTTSNKNWTEIRDD